MKELKAVKLALKDLSAADAPGTFSGRASVYGVTDSYGDVVMPGAFTKTIMEHGGRIVILAQHDPSATIGIGELSDEQDGLHIRGSLVMDLPEARDTYARLKAGLITGLSIGYETIKEKFEAGVRQLLEVRLWEVSLVTFPANTFARVTGVKALEDALQVVGRELKEGRELSTANRNKIAQIADGLEAHAATLKELLAATEPKPREPKAETGTPAEGAATDPDLEPDDLHSLIGLLGEMHSLTKAVADGR